MNSLLAWKSSHRFISPFHSFSRVRMSTSTRFLDKYSKMILKYWFEELTPSQHFSKDPVLDFQIHTKFNYVITDNLHRPIEEFLLTPECALAAVILFDQFPRNMYRNNSQSFEYDRIALTIAEFAVNRDFHLQLPDSQRNFLLMPYMHSESLNVQNTGVELFAYDPQTQHYAILHRNIIENFGRFPHRNAILGRESTPDELEFLTQEGSSF